MFPFPNYKHFRIRADSAKSTEPRDSSALVMTE